MLLLFEGMSEMQKAFQAYGWKRASIQKQETYKSVILFKSMQNVIIDKHK